MVIELSPRGVSGMGVRVWAWVVVVAWWCGVLVVVVEGVVTNVVKEVPSLDVGPLVVVRVARGDTARLPCGHPEAQPGDHLSLVLWYRDKTSRPFLSYDARNKTAELQFTTAEQPTPTTTTTTTTAAITTTTALDPYYNDSNSITERQHSNSSLEFNSIGKRKERDVTEIRIAGNIDNSIRETVITENNRTPVENVVDTSNNRFNRRETENGRSKNSNDDKLNKNKTRKQENGGETKEKTGKEEKRTNYTTKTEENDQENEEKQETAKENVTQTLKFQGGLNQNAQEEKTTERRVNDETGGGGGNGGKERRYLEEGGTTLVVERAREKDESEYRCRVHFRLSPTWTRRLLLLVNDDVTEVRILDEEGNQVKGQLPPVAEGANITLTCRAKHGKARVVGLSWLLNGDEIDSTWQGGGASGGGIGGDGGMAKNTLHLTKVEGRYRGAHLTCRLISTLATPELPSTSTTSTSTTSTSPPLTTSPPSSSFPSFTNITTTSTTTSTTTTTATTTTTTTSPPPPPAVATAANITYASTRISMFYVPEASLSVEGGRGGIGTAVEVDEGDSVTFLCSVSADPPAYNITWLHNGRVVGVGGRRWMRDRASLVVSPLERTDAGLYTCLASNREGDGHSNAVLLRVNHPPYCAGVGGAGIRAGVEGSAATSTHVVVASNTSVSLRCRVEAVPRDVTFTWKVGPPLPLRGLPGELDPLKSPSTGQTPPMETPGPWEEAWKELESGEGASVKGRRDPKNPEASILTLTPGASKVVGCFARNRAGHTRVPCRYTLTVVEPPKALTSCNVTLLEVTRMEVKCQDPVHAPPHEDRGESTPPFVQHSPSLSFVRSPGASTTKANMEVWSGKTLVANVSEGRPQFTVRGLPPDTELRLVLYTATPHARSTPLHLHARTLPRKVAHFTVPPPPSRPNTRPPPSAAPPDAPESTPFDMGWEVVGGVIGGCLGLVVVVVVLGAAKIWRRRRRGRGRGLVEESGGDGDDGGGGGGDESEVVEQQHLQHHTLVSTVAEEGVWVGGVSGGGGGDGSGVGGLEWQSSVM